MNQMAHTLNPPMTRITRIPMRHTFTIEQKNILLQCFEEGMVGQSLAYQDKIAQCAQKSGLDFDTVKNWVGNQRRKRRMEEMQYVRHEQPFGPSSNEVTLKYQRTADISSAPQRQPVQVLYFPRSSAGPVNQQGKPVNPSVHHSGVPIRQPTTRNPGPSSQYSPQTNPQAVGGSRGIPTTHLDHNHTATNFPSGSCHGVPNHCQTSTQVMSSRPCFHIRHAAGNKRDCFAVEHPSSASTNSVPVRYSDGYHRRVGPHMDDKGRHHGSGETSIRVGPVMPPGQHDFSDVPPQASNNHIRSPILDSFNGGAYGMEHSCDPAGRELQIQKIIETIQIYVDQLHKLGCEAFLASVSKDTLSTYLCGTPLGNNYFTDINRENPLSEFIERKLDPAPDSEMNSEHNVEEDSETNPEANPGIHQDVNSDSEEVVVNLEVNSEGNLEVNPEEDISADPDGTVGGQEMCGEGEEVMADGEGDKGEPSKNMGDDQEPIEREKPGDIQYRSGEEVYIVNKEHFIIGKGTLLPAPHQKITPKNLPEEVGSHAGEDDEDGFIDDEYS